MVWVDSCSRHVSWWWWCSIKTLEPPVTESEGTRGWEEVNKRAVSFSKARIYVKLYFVKCPECLFICRLCPSYLGPFFNFLL